MPPSVPKAEKNGKCRIDCDVCGTHGWYSFAAMDSHANWCTTAKRQNEAATKEKEAKGHRTKLKR